MYFFSSVWYNSEAEGRGFKSRRARQIVQAAVLWFSTQVCLRYPHYAQKSGVAPGRTIAKILAVDCLTSPENVASDSDGSRSN